MSAPHEALLLRQCITVRSSDADASGLLRPAAVLTMAQDISAAHCEMLGCGKERLAAQGLIWVVLRHRIAVERLPAVGEAVFCETWPLPTTRSCYPRCVEARDKDGAILFRVHTLWSLLHRDTRAMCLPAKSGIVVPGLVRGTELPAPTSLAPVSLETQTLRRVEHTDLDENGHMNNARYLQWIADAAADALRAPVTIRLCYIGEALMGQTLCLHSGRLSDGTLRVELTQADTARRVLGAQIGG